jgi:hypothetical protein
MLIITRVSRLGGDSEFPLISRKCLEIDYRSSTETLFNLCPEGMKHGDDVGRS